MEQSSNSNEKSTKRQMKKLTTHEFLCRICIYTEIWVEFICVLRHMQRYFSHICDGKDLQADWRRSCTYGRVPNAIETFRRVLIVLVLHRYGTTLCIRRFRHTAPLSRLYDLKLYCRYLYTRPCMINHIWGLKKLWLQVNGHAWFHLQRLRWPVRNGEGAKNSKWKYMSPAEFEPTPRQSTTGKLQRLRPLGHAG